MPLNKIPFVSVLLLAPSLILAQYSMNFSCLGDTVIIAVDTTSFVQFYFRLQNTGSMPDSYAFDCRVEDSIPGWEEMFCVGGNCGLPGMILYDHLIPTAIDTNIDVQLFLNSAYGIERINLHVQSVHASGVRDSINIYVKKELSVEEKFKNYYPSKTIPHLIVSPNPFHKSVTITSINLAANQSATLCLYDELGNLVRDFSPVIPLNGKYRIIWDGCDSKRQRVASGVYICHLKSGRVEEIKKIVLLK